MENADGRIFTTAMHEQSDTASRKIVKHIATLGAVHEGTYLKHYEAQTVLCPYCKGAKASFQHFTWLCKHPTLQKARQDGISDIQNTIVEYIEAIPTYMQL
eukprot:8779804-Karenia_brevis.AAC.1